MAILFNLFLAHANVFSCLLSFPIRDVPSDNGQPIMKYTLPLIFIMGRGRRTNVHLPRAYDFDRGMAWAHYHKLLCGLLLPLEYQQKCAYLDARGTCFFLSITGSKSTAKLLDVHTFLLSLTEKCHLWNISF